MKFLKSKSFKSKKKKNSTTETDGSTGVVQSTTEDNVQQTSAIITPPSSPQAAATGDEEVDSQQDNKYYTGPPAAIPPAYPSTPLGLGEPIRVGSFNFDEPTSNGNNSNKQTRTLTFPPLFTEADTMIKLSNLIYTLVELRDLARNGVLNNPASSMRILDTPLPLDTAVTIITQEGEMLKEILDDGKHEATLSALESLLARQRESAAAKGSKLAQEKKDSDDNGMFGWMTNWDGCLAGGFSFDELFCGNVGDILGEETVKQSEGDETMSSMVTTVNDVKSTEELVYAVGVNPIEERITVIFRGSVTKADFITDSKISIVQAPNPQRYNDTVVDGMPVGGDVGVHQGFYEYLFTEGKKGKPSKYVEIMKHVQKLYKESPTRRNYKLYVTGHSLGGALATLFGFYAAASPSLPLPVTVVSVASPRVGNIDFARTFAELESQGKLRHLRIANHKDPVALGPTISSKRALALSAKAFSPLGYLALHLSGNGEGGDEKYFHTGIKMKLFKSVSPVSSRRCDFSYSGASVISGAKKPTAIAKDELEEIEQSNKKKKGSSSELPMVSYHYGSAYAERMALVESDLKDLTLNTLYREKACTTPWANLHPSMQPPSP